MAAVLAAVVPSSASAVTTCVKSGVNVSITLFADNDQASLTVGAGDEIVITGALGAPVTCSGGAPTLTNVDTISITQTGSLRGTAGIFMPPGGFGPGATAEPGGTSEIEIVVDLGDGEEMALLDSFSISPAASDDLDQFRFGTLAGGGIGGNLNLPEPGPPDGDDVRLIDVEVVNAATGAPGLEFDATTIDASGGPEFTGPVASGQLNLTGANGPDTFVGGNSFNVVHANDGADLVVSGPGTDQLFGGPGNDTVSYVRATGAVTVDMSRTDFQETGGSSQEDLDSFVNLIGSPFGDTISATNEGNDVNGRGGTDTITLLGDNDTFDALDGTPDTIDCGNGLDSGTSDEAGVDAIAANCETVNFVPSTTISAGPSDGGFTNDSTPTYELTANEAASFALSVDGGGFQPCSAACEVPSLADGPHTLTFRATDTTGLVEQTPVARSVTVDTAPPETSIDSGPADGSLTSEPSATYGFSSGDGASFECSLDGAAFTTCASPANFGGLGDGSHTLDVRAVDVAANADPSPARRTLRVDTAAPETSLKKPKFKGSKVTFKFSSDEDDATFECKLDKKDFKPCESPKSYRRLDAGKHKFLVVATDAAGNEEDKAAKAKFDVG